ncbi:DUF4280 domain-containing protein [Fibrella arboris]|uniref:DUF4280 domain-containing protein n=1 Tax=Fibrella arboris TaxID=3242486 RepID=UPI003520EBC3
MADGDKYIPNGVWLRCDKGTLTGRLTIIPKTVKLYGQDWAGQFDATPMVNIPTFGVCAIIKACVPATVVWQGTQADVSTLGQSPILDTSTCQCTVGGTIRIYFTKQAADDAGAEQEAKEDANFWGDIATGLLIAGAVVGTVAIVVASGGTALAVLGAAAATGAAVGGVAGAVQGGITGGASGAASGFLMGAGLGALGGIAAVGAPLLAGAAAVAGVISLGYLGKAFYHNPSQENGLVLVGATAAIIAGGLTGRGVNRLQQMRATPKAIPPQNNPAPKPTTRQLADEAHALLKPDTQRYKTTAVGRDKNGKLYISSSDERVPPVQREWAKQQGITPVKGKGHAEETIIKNVKEVEHVDASRHVCLDCQGTMHQNKVSTDTPFSGKRSRNRANSSNAPNAPPSGKPQRQRKKKP